MTDKIAKRILPDGQPKEPADRLNAPVTWDDGAARYQKPVPRPTRVFRGG